MRDDSLEALVAALLELPQMQALWHVKDRGMPVFAHTVDVALLCLERFPETRDYDPAVSLRIVVLGSLLHDLSKVSGRETALGSHSRIMSYYPDLAATEARFVLREALARTESELADDEVEGILHVVVSHHGPWGKVHPQTTEARLVHSCDLYSAMHHRFAPIDANDILPHLEQGRKLSVVSALLGVGVSVLRQRLRDACLVERVDEWQDLLDVWRRRGFVVIGDSERVRQLERVRFALDSAREVPDSIFRVIAAL
jgi:hypothetical protein